MLGTIAIKTEFFLKKKHVQTFLEVNNAKLPKMNCSYLPSWAK